MSLYAKITTSALVLIVGLLVALFVSVIGNGAAGLMADGEETPTEEPEGGYQWGMSSRHQVESID